MKKIIFTFVLLITIMTSVAAIDESDLNLLTVVNKSGKDIYYLFISPADSSDWGPEVLGSDNLLEDDGLISFYIHYPDNCNDFDIYAIDEDDSGYTYWDYSICDDEEMTLTISSKDRSEDDSGMYYITVNLYNELKTDVYYMFLSPSDSSMWGADLLDDETILEPGDYHSILVPASEDDVEYDFMCMDENGDEYQFTLTLNEEYEDLDISIEPSDLVE